MIGLSNDTISFLISSGIVVFVLSGVFLLFGELCCAYGSSNRKLVKGFLFICTHVAIPSFLFIYFYDSIVGLILFVSKYVAVPMVFWLIIQIISGVIIFQGLIGFPEHSMFALYCARNQNLHFNSKVFLFLVSLLMIFIGLYYSFNPSVNQFVNSFNGSAYLTDNVLSLFKFVLLIIPVLISLVVISFIALFYRYVEIASDILSKVKKQN